MIITAQIYSEQVYNRFISYFFSASLVPIFSFGETDLYEQVDNPQGSLLRKLQNVMTTYFGFSPPLFHGRGVFNYSFGILPFRKPVNTVCKLNAYNLIC